VSHLANSFRAGRNHRSANIALKENGRAREACRERGENSNMAIVRPRVHSGFVAAIQPETVEFFSRQT